jgi:DegV family protein with EDD domain
MANNYILSCCSTSDLNVEHYKARNLHYVCYHFTLGDKEYPDDFYESIPLETFYTEMGKGVMTKTSQVTTGQFVEYFEPFLKEGKDILHVCLSSGITGVLNSANAAKEMLSEKYPDRKIYIVDSLGASSGYGLFMDKLADLRDEGYSLEKLRDWAEENRLYVHHWFFSTDLEYYVRGGRITKTQGFIGNILHLCPLMNMDNLGRLIPRKKIIGKRNVINEIVKMMEENAIDGLNYSGKCYICNSLCYDDARRVADLVEAKFPKLNGKVEIYNIGTTIGSHTGPGTVALFFFGKKRID